VILREKLRFLLVVGLLVLTALFVHGRGQTEKAPARLTFSSFPLNLADWRGIEVEIPEGTLEILGPGDYLARRLVNGQHDLMDLFVAYFASQRTGNAIHSPKNCMPGAGWIPVETGVTQVDVAGYEPIHANRYVLSKGSSRLLVLYWYQSHGRTVASEYSAKIYLVMDAARLNRTDGALVRVVTPVFDGEDITKAEERARGFIQQLVPELAAYIPN
jgi:EpsI family protein